MAFGISAGVHATSQYSTAGALRFVQRGEKRILQQEWTVKTTYSDTSASSTKEWRDVPLVGEEVRKAYPPIGSGNLSLGNVDQPGQSRVTYAELSSTETVYPQQD